MNDQTAAQDLVALDEFDRYRKLIQDVNTLLKAGS